MKITKDDLATLLSDPEYRTLATNLTLEQHENTTWWNTLDLMMTSCAKATVWETTQLIALLFDTYPNQIKNIEVAFENDHQDGQTNMLIGIRINGNYCDIDSLGPMKHVIALMAQKRFNGPL